MKLNKFLLIILTATVAFTTTFFAKDAISADANLTNNVQQAGAQYEQSMKDIIRDANNAGTASQSGGSGNSELGTMLGLSFKQAATEIKKDAQVGVNQALSNARKQQAQKTEKHSGQ